VSSKRVLYNEFINNPYHLNIVDYLYDKHNWEPVFMNGNPSMETISLLHAKYPDLVTANDHDLRSSIFDYSNISEQIPIDASIVNSLSKYESNFISILTESEGAPGNFTYAQRKRFYYDLLKYWNSVICTFKPNLVIFFTWPHTQSCYTLYHICKYHFNIEVLILDPVPHLNRNYYLIGNSLEKLFQPIVGVYKDDKTLSIGSDAKQYLREMKSKDALPPAHIVNTYKMLNKLQRFPVKALITLIIKTILFGYGCKKDAQFKKNKKPYYLESSQMNNIEYFFFNQKIRRNNKKLLKYYVPLCVNPNYEQKYLYFAASYQPEAVTRTNAGVYEDQFLALDILAAVLPKGWIIYYKENPTIFDASGITWGSFRRDKYYYQRIQSYDNIKMLLADVSTFDLIDNAQAVATVSGTVAWEAAVRGKPSLSFGSAWYMGCDSIFWIKTLQDAKDAIEKILAGFKPDAQDIERYTTAIEKVAVKGMIHNNFDDNIKKCENPEYEMERIAKALYESYDRLY
jgi:hypothetical protein